jgi:hypothetical protein
VVRRLRLREFLKFLKANDCWMSSLQLSPSLFSSWDIVEVGTT